MLPNFICPGAQKSATSTLYNILKQHPDIYLPNVKEPLFFSVDRFYSKGIDWYEKKYFSFDGDFKAVGDMSTTYMHSRNVPERLYKHLGNDIKFIFLLRNPIERAYSHYLMNYAKCIEKEKNFIDALNINNPKGGYYSVYIERSLYAKHIRNFLKFFPKKNMHFEIFENFVENPYERTAEILAFFNLPMHPGINCDIKTNSAWKPRFRLLNSIISWKTLRRSTMHAPAFLPKLLKRLDAFNRIPLDKPPMQPEAVKELSVVFKEDVDELESIIDKDLDMWRKSWI